MRTPKGAGGIRRQISLRRQSSERVMRQFERQKAAQQRRNEARKARDEASGGAGNSNG